tara:strand:- start:654 stop:1391 length:738 start_codon:yes stop_codon:yes gene_type:complete
MKRKTLLLLGAKSDIGLAIAHRFASEGFDIQLAGRNSKILNEECLNISVRHRVKCTFHELDILNYQSHQKFLNSLPKLPSIALSAIGYLDNQIESENDIKETIKTIRTNFEGLVLIFNIIANKFALRGYGTLIGISSVAGDRGRSSNYLYGSSKAGFTTYLSGLRNKLYNSNVNVITIKPGYVRTKMTSHLKLPSMLTTDPKTVANYIYSAYKKKKNIVYITNIWKYIMKLIKILPEGIFKKLKF